MNRGISGRELNSRLLMTTLVLSSLACIFSGCCSFYGGERRKGEEGKAKSEHKGVLWTGETKAGPIVHSHRKGEREGKGKGRK